MKKILIIDNDPDILHIVNIILTQANLEVMSLQNAHNIHDDISRFRPDLVLLDIFLRMIKQKSLNNFTGLMEKTNLRSPVWASAYTSVQK